MWTLALNSNSFFIRLLWHSVFVVNSWKLVTISCLKISDLSSEILHNIQEFQLTSCIWRILFNLWKILRLRKMSETIIILITTKFNVCICHIGYKLQFLFATNCHIYFCYTPLTLKFHGVYSVQLSLLNYFIVCGISLPSTGEQVNIRLHNKVLWVPNNHYTNLEHPVFKIYVLSLANYRRFHVNCQECIHISTGNEGDVHFNQIMLLIGLNLLLWG